MRSQRLSGLNSPGNATFLLSGLISFFVFFSLSNMASCLERACSPVRVRARAARLDFVAAVLWCTGEREWALVGRPCPFLFKRNYSCVNRTETPDAEPHY